MRCDLSESRGWALLDQACTITGLDAAGARLLRMGSNAVYSLTDPVVVRVSRANTEIDRARRTVAVARWLESVGFPAVRVADVDQPIVIDGHVITFWQSVSEDGDQFATVAEVAEVLARLHRLAAPLGLNLPALTPFVNAAMRISTSNWLSNEDRLYLNESLTRMQVEYLALEFDLAPGVIHGDAGIGNVLRDYRGRPVLIDLDGFAIGPREWDLALTAIYYDSFGWHTREEYETFVRVYGFDIMHWSGYPVMRAVREFLMVTWIIQKAGGSYSASLGGKSADVPGGLKRLSPDRPHGIMR
jgi:aminoglycoside phosphotransferase (APT) family kinase protein